MDFIVTRFIRMLERDFNLNLNVDRDEEEDTCIIIIKKLDDEFKQFLLKLRYHPVTGENVVKDSSGKVIKTTITRGKAKICLPYGKNGIMISFNENNYGEFVNILDYNIRKYYETHSQIDMINNCT